MANKLLALAIVITISILSGNTYAQAPVASFSASKTAGCSPVVVQFTDNSTGSPTSWHWDLGNGGSSTLQNPAASYIAPGTYTVILTATNSNGSTKDTGYITVYTSPTVAFSTDTTSACDNKTVTFTNSTTPGAGGAVSYLWDFGDGDSSTAVSPTHTYTSSGTYSVTLVVSNSNGCTSTLTKANYITVLPRPTAAFTASNTSSCTAPFLVNFTNSSSNATTYAWTFGDGNSSTATNPSNTYTTTGTYSVSLIANGINGCKDTLTRSSYIAIGQVNANFTSGPACQGAFTNFTNTSTPGIGISRTWNFGGGNTDTAVNPSFVFGTPGTYSVTLIENYANSCSDTVTKSVTVTTGPTAQFTTNDTVGCNTPFAASFTNSSTGATSYSWNFGDGSNSSLTSPTHSYTSQGTYTVTLTATNANGCTSTQTRSSYIKIKEPKGNLNTVPSNGGCPNEPIQFNASVDTPLYAISYRWDYGDGSSIVTCASCSTQTHSYSSTGTYNMSVVVTTATGCDDTLFKTVNISSKPTASFTGSPLTLCPDNSVSFTNSSTGATSYTWSFGDGATGNSTSPSHLYEQAGLYDVVLIAHNGGCSDTQTRNNYVNVELPAADFVPSFACSSSLSYTFTDGSQGANTYYWDFGDGTTSTTSGTVSHTYSTAGTYNVMLAVYNSSTGCTDTLYKTIKPAILSVPSFTANDSNFCKGSLLILSRGGSSDLTYSWKVGSLTNNTQSTSAGFSLNTSGIFDVKLIVTDSFGCKDSVVKSNYIRVGGTTADFTLSNLNPCKNTSILFTDASVQGAFPIVNRYWDFDDGQQSNTPNDTIYHTYNNGGAYDVKLVITDSLGCKDSVTKTGYFTVNSPTANFYTNDTLVCAGDTVQFYNNSGGVSFTSLWDFGDGNTSTNITPAHSYANLGTYSVKLVITDSFGCKDSTTKVNYINVEKPTAAFTMSDSVAACPPLTVYLTNNTSNGSTYSWSFGNGNQSSNVNSSVTYTYPGVYTVSLIATNAAGCKDTANNSVTVNGPTGTFSYTPDVGCTPLTVTFTATSSNTTSYIWDMNNGVTQTTSNGSLTYTYTQTGMYVPTVILSDGASCQVPLQNTDTIVVDEVTADFSFTSAGNLCNTDTVFFDDTVSYTLSAVASRSWDFGDGSSSSAADPSHYYSMPGTYQVRLIVTNANGCDDTVTKTVIVNGLPNVNIAASGDSLCPGQTTGIQLTATGADTFAWTPTTGLSCTSCANPIANPQVNTTYIVTGTDTNGCVNYDTVTIGIKPKPVITVSNDTSICEGLSVQLGVTGAYTYSWTPTTGLSCAACNNPVATPTNSGTYTVIGTNASGCKDTNDVTITVLPKPVITASNNQTICLGDSALLIVTGTDNYSWTPTSTLSCSSCDSTYAFPTATTTYTVIGTSSNSCKDTTTVDVTVNPLPNVDAGADKDICIGNSTTLLATGATTYDWTPATGLSCTNCANPTANPTTTTTYIVWGTDGNSCSNSDTVDVIVNPLPNIDAGGNQTICEGFSVSLMAIGATTYSWTPSTGLSCTNCANPTASPTTTTKYYVTGTDGNSCTNIDSITVNVNPQPTVSAGSDKNICPADSVQLQANGADTYVWSPANGLSCTNCADPKASPFATTTYTVIGTDVNGCKDTSTVKVNVNAPPVVSAGNNVAICIGSTTSLQATGAASYTWSPATGLSCTNCANPTANPTTTTTYTVIGANGNSCLDTATVTVTVNPLPSVNAGNDQTICAGFSANLQATGATSYSWSPTTGLNNPNIPSPIASPTTTTTYIVTGTDGNSCVNTDTVTVFVNPQPTVSAGSDKNICPADSVQLQATGAASYTWTPTNGLSCTNCADPKASPVTTTTYTVIGTDTNGCKDTNTVKVTVNPPPVVNAGSNVAICIGNSTTLQATGAASYSWSPATGLSCTNCASPTANPTTTTTYTVIGANGNSCLDTATVTVTVNPLPNVNAGNDQTICVGFSANLQATGATSYSWTPTTGLSNPNIPSPVASPTTTTTYIVTGTDGNSCINTDTVTIFVNPQPTVNSSNKTICLGDSTQLQATGAASYTWSPATGLSCTSCAIPKASPATTTTYTLVGTDVNGCKDTTSVTVTVNSLPVVNAGADQNICIGSSVNLSATGASSYTWTPGTGLSCSNCANPTASPATTTTYIVTGTNGNGCSDTDHITITVNPLPSVNAGNDQSICLNDSAQLQATGATSYVWTPATGLSSTTIANPKASPATTTTYTVTGTDNNGCVNTSTVTVTIKSLPGVNAGTDQTICSGDTAQLQATGATSYVWTPNSALTCNTCADPKAYPSATTQYIVTGTGSNACSSTDTVIVNVNALPTVTTDPDTSICKRESIQITANGASTYTWSPSANLSCANCPDPIAQPDTTITYIVTGTDANGCKNTADITITIKPLPIITVTAARDSICAGDTTQLNANGGVTYAWTQAGLSCNNCPNPVASPQLNTRYIVTGEGSNGCTDTASVFIEVLARPLVQATPGESFCIGGSDTLKATGADSYTWTPAANLSCTNCDETIANPTTTTMYVVTGVDSNGCIGKDSTTVTVFNLPSVSAGDDQTFCEGDSVQLNASGASTYLWTPSTGLSCTACFNPKATTGTSATYTVTGTDNNGCVNTDEVSITAIIKQGTSYSRDDSICIGESVDLFAEGGTSYIWSPAESLSNTSAANTTASPTTTTKYMVIIKQGDCFTDTGYTNITVFGPPEIDAGPDQEVRGGNEIKLETRSSGVAEYEWTPTEHMSCFDCPNPIVSPLRTTTYTVKAISEYGCVAEDNVTVIVTCGADQLFIANTFTPNGDGVNDTFFPQGKGLTTIKRFSVYTRWGQLVYDVQDIPLNDPTYGWDGTYKFEPLKPDVFVYIVRAVCESGEPIEVKGDISLIR